MDKCTRVCWYHYFAFIIFGVIFCFICCSLSEKQPEEVFKNTTNIVFVSNTAHIIALSVDSYIAQVGGLKPLLSLSTKKALQVCKYA